MPWIKVNSDPPKPTTFEDLGYVQVVRCKFCKHCDDIDIYGYVHCDKEETHESDYYCADGERVTYENI